MGLAQCFEPHRRFNCRRTPLEDDERCRRPASTVNLGNVEKMHRFVLENRRKIMSDILDDVGQSYRLVQAIVISELPMRRVSAMFITADHWVERTSCRSLSRFPLECRMLMTHPPSRGHHRWHNRRDRRRRVKAVAQSCSLPFRHLCCRASKIRLPLPGSNRHSRALLRHFEASERGHWAESDQICGTRRDRFLTSTMHRDLLTREFLVKDNILSLPHQTYLTGLGSEAADFHPFPKTKMKIKHCCFNTAVEIQSEPQNILDSLTVNDFQARFQKWDPSIVVQGDNFKGDVVKS